MIFFTMYDKSIFFIAFHFYKSSGEEKIQGDRVDHKIQYTNEHKIQML